MKRAKLFTIIALGILLAFWAIQSARAEIYKWVDEKGTVHFTEDPSTIPEKYRNQIKSGKTEEDYMSTEEKAKAKHLGEQKARERMERSQREYEKTLEEERRRKAEKDAKNKLDEIQMELQKSIKKQEDAIKQEQRDREREREQYKKCWNCDGKGYIGKEVMESHGGVPSPSARPFRTQKACSICGGTGYVRK